MGMFARMSTIVKSKMNRILDSAEDPRETLDYSYEQQREMLQNVKRGVVEMVSAKRRIQQQATKVQENITRLDQQARQAVEVGREDLARLALQRKQTALIELQGLDEQIAGMELEQEKLTLAEQRLQAKVEAFRTKKEIIKAQYTAAQAQVRIGSALSGLSEEMGDISMAIERAENKTDQMRSTAGAIDELASSGVLEDFTGRQDDIGRQLDQLSASQNVDDELAALKSGLPGAQNRAIQEGR
jgi:phage shock protein A